MGTGREFPIIEVVWNSKELVSLAHDLLDLFAQQRSLAPKHRVTEDVHFQS